MLVFSSALTCSRLETNPCPPPASLRSATPFPLLPGWVSCAWAAGLRFLQLPVGSPDKSLCVQNLFVSFPVRIFSPGLCAQSQQHGAIPAMGETLRECMASALVSAAALHWRLSAGLPCAVAAAESCCGTGRAVGVTALYGYNP